MKSSSSSKKKKNKETITHLLFNMWCAFQDPKKVNICSHPPPHPPHPGKQPKAEREEDISVLCYQTGEQLITRTSTLSRTAAAAFRFGLSASLTCALCQRGAQAQVEVVYPNVSSAAVRKETFHHHLPRQDRGEETEAGDEASEDRGQE